jgi:hypothetical protein
MTLHHLLLGDKLRGLVKATVPNYCEDLTSLQLFFATFFGFGRLEQNFVRKYGTDVQRLLPRGRPERGSGC